MKRKSLFFYLNELADKYLYSNINYLTTDTDLLSLHKLPQWASLIEKVNQNKATLPQRRKRTIRDELFKAKSLVEADNGMLWTDFTWDDHILVIDNENAIYTLNNQVADTQTDSLLHYKTIKENQLQQTNTNQIFEGQKWATIQSGSVTASDSCQTIIHELFHLFHLKQITLSGNIVEYLDHYEARILLRSEFNALRNCLMAIQKKNETDAKQFLNDAFYFREQREKMFKKSQSFCLGTGNIRGFGFLHRL